MVAPFCCLPAMKKLLLILIALSTLLLAACGDREAYRAHRAERNKPRVVAMEHSVMLMRRPYPQIHILADGNLRIDDIDIPTDEHQRTLLREVFVKMQILRQNTLTSDTTQARAPKIQAPANLVIFPPELIAAVPELRDYTECFDNLVAER